MKTSELFESAKTPVLKYKSKVLAVYGLENRSISEVFKDLEDHDSNSEKAISKTLEKMLHKSGDFSIEFRTTREVPFKKYILELDFRIEHADLIDGTTENITCTLEF